MTRIALVGLAFAALLAGAAMAVTPGERLSDPALEARARTLSSELRCLVCQNQSIDDSDAPLAHDLRVLVRERLTAGDSDAAVQDFIVARYGEFVLLRPVFAARTLLLWLAPVLLILLGLAGLVVWYRRPAAPPAADLTTEEKAALKALTHPAPRG